MIKQMTVWLGVGLLLVLTGCFVLSEPEASSGAVVAPTLASKAKERRRPAEGMDQPATAYEPPVFREPSGRLVVAVRSPDELERARAVMAEVEAATIVVAEGANR